MARKTNGALAGTNAFRRSAMYGLGWVMRNEFDTTGREFCYCDTAGCYTRAPESDTWEQMFRVDFSVASEHVTDVLDVERSAGCYSLAPCWNQSGKGVLAMLGYWWRFTDSGQTNNSVTPISGFPLQDLNANERVRMIGPISACDPNNPNHAGITTPTGMYYIDSSGGAIKHPDIGPAIANSRHGIAYDPASPTINGKIQGWYIFEHGIGLKHSTTGLAGTFSLIANSPTSAQGITIGGDGTVYVTQNGVDQTSGLRRYIPGVGWSSELKSDCHGVATSPYNANWLWSISQGGALSFSNNQGNTWAAHPGWKRTALDVPVMAATAEGYMSAGSIKWDPYFDGISFAQGLGMWFYENPPTTYATVQSSQVQWHSRTKGIAQKCVDHLMVVHAPGTPSDGDVMVTGQDRGHLMFPRNEVDTPPTGHGPTYFQPLQHASTADYASQNPDYRVMCLLGVNVPVLGNRVIFESYNRGFPGTWSPVDNPPDEALSGNIACGGIGRMFYQGMIADVTGPYAYGTGGNDIKRAFIKKPGQAWYPADIAGGRSLGNSDSGYTSKTCRVCHDPFVPGQYFTAPTGNGSGDADDIAVTGIWQVRDDGTSGVKVSPALETQALNYWGMSLKFNPLREGHFGYCAGHVGGTSNPGGSELWLTQNRFASVKALPGFGEVYDFAYMAADVGEPYERLLVIGWRNDGTFGMYLVYNLDMTPTIPTYQYTKLSRWPLGWYDYYARAAGDHTMFGRAYVGGSGSGMSVLDYQCVKRWTA